jgi:hypothetical protein
VIELYVPPNPSLEPELELGRVGRGYRDLFAKTDVIAKQGACNIDVICPEGDDWRHEIQSVAMLSVNLPDGTARASGTMIMDTEGSFRPYFLTAYHAGVTEANDQTVVTYWNYRSPTCGQLSGGSLDQTIIGSTLLAGRQEADFALLELDSMPPEEFNVYWAGWDRRDGFTPQGAVTIHHASGEEKVISFDDDPLTIMSVCSPVDVSTGESFDVETPWRVGNWERGTTEAGSSGGGLWDANSHLLIGQLSGGTASCNFPSGWDCYGRFTQAWGGDDASQRLDDWLDPSEIGTELVTGRYLSGAGTNFSCGNAGYDSNVFAGAAWFDGGKAGDPNYMFAVRFRLSDFGYQPGEAQLSGFCASNTWNYGGPWPNEVFIYPDSGGLPDDGQVLAQGTIVTGDGAGDSVVTLSEPVVLNGDFWLVVRGDPMHASQDFNLEFDAGPNVGNSYVSNSGISGLTTDNRIDPTDEDPIGYPDGVNYLLRATLEPVGGAAAHTYLTAGIARTAGQQGSNWRSKVAVLNRSGAAATATLSYVRPTSTATVTIGLRDGELDAWDNVLEDLFDLSSDSKGALKVESDRPLVVTARTYNLTDSGTFGQFLPGVTSSETLGTGQIGVISQLSNNSAFRTNIGFINLSLIDCQVRVRLYDVDGNQVGAPVVFDSLGPMGYDQKTNVFGKAGAGRHDNAYARVDVLTPGCSVWGYASVIDELTNDATTIPMVEE